MLCEVQGTLTSTGMSGSFDPPPPILPFTRWRVKDFWPVGGLVVASLLVLAAAYMALRVGEINVHAPRHERMLGSL